MIRKTQIGIILTSLIIATMIVYAGEDCDRIITQFLIREDFTDAQIQELLAMPRLPVINKKTGLFDAGEQVWLDENHSKMLVYTFDDQGCYAVWVVYDFTNGDKK